MCNDTVRALVDSQMIFLNIDLSEPSYWIYDQCNCEIDLLVMDDNSLLYVTEIVCDHDQYEIHTIDNENILDFDADKLVLRSRKTGHIVSWQLYANQHINLIPE
jgi:hypothetical protein